MPCFPLLFRSGCRSARFLPALLLLSPLIVQADWNVTVGAASSNGAWSGASPDVWTPSASGATVSATEINTRLDAGTPVEIKAVAGSGAEAGNIVISQPIISTHASANLTLTPGAGGSYTVKSPVTLSGASPSLTIAAAAYTVVNSAAALQNMNTGLSTNYALGSDIDASSIANFSPVGDNITKFTGNFTGLGHTVSGLTINRTTTNYVGLFGYATGTLRDVGLLNSSIAGQMVVGTLAGRSDGAISFSYADGGSVTSQQNIAGGLVGQANGAIATSYANVSVTGASNGVSSTAIGGLAGSLLSSGSISNSYATGSVSGGTDVGGLAGQINANVTNCYATGALSWTASGGGLIGLVSSGTVSNSYWNKATTGKSSSAGGTGVGTTVLMQTQSTFSGFDFSNTWRIYAGHTYPLLKHFLTPLTVTAGNYSLGYNGSAYTATLNNPSYSVSGAASSGHLFNLSNAYNSPVSVGSYTPDLYSDQRGYDITYSGGTLTIVVIPPDPPHVYASAGVETTLSDTTPVTARPGSILVIPTGANVAGVSITLSGPTGGESAAPITFRIGGLTITLSGYTPGLVVTFKKVRVNGLERLVLAVDSGRLTLSAAAGQPLMTLNGSATLTAGDGGTSVNFSANGDGSGYIAVTDGSIVLSANAFAATGGYAALKDGKLYAGEVATFDSAGKITGAHVGSVDGNAGLFGDPLGQLSPTDPTARINLHGKAARVSTGQDFTDALAIVLGVEFTSAGQNADGVLRLKFAGGTVNALPIGTLLIDTGRADGVVVRDDGTVEVTVDGIVVTFVPAVTNMNELLGLLPPGTTAQTSHEGVITVSTQEKRYWLRPAWLATATSTTKGLIQSQTSILFEDGTDSYTLLPSFADFAALRHAINQELPDATLSLNADGSASLSIQGKNYVLKPLMAHDIKLGTDSAIRILSGQHWWQDSDGRLLLNVGGVTQAFTVQ